jgi:hypothetical protein
MSRETKNTTLNKLLEDPKALHWLKKHSDEFSVDEYRGGKRAFNTKVSPELEIFADKLLLVQDRLPPEYQLYATHYLNDPPRNVARKTGLPIKQIYRHYERLRQLVAQEYLAYKAEQRGRRVGKVSLDTLPIYSCTASHTLEYLGTRKNCYLVPYEGEKIWVDENANIFPEEVQEILYEVHSLDLGAIDAK